MTKKSLLESLGEFETGNIKRRLKALRTKETREKKKVISKIIGKNVNKGVRGTRGAKFYNDTTLTFDRKQNLTMNIG